MAAPDKQMGKADLESFLNQQFPKSKEVNNLLEQITSSKNRMEKAMGEEIPSFYGTISRLISTHTVNGISDWVNSNGQVNVSRINKAAEIAKREFQVQKRQEEEEQAKNNKQQNYINELNQSNDAKVDLSDITESKFIDIAMNIDKYWDRMGKEEQQVLTEATDKMAGTAEPFQLLQKALFDPSILENPQNLETIKNGVSPNLYKKVFPDGRFSEEVMKDILLKKIKIIGELSLIRENGELSVEIIQSVCKKIGLDGEEYEGLIDTEYILQLSPEDLNKVFEDIRKKVADLELSKSPRQTGIEASTLEYIQRADEALSAAGDSDYTEMFFDDLFAGAIDFAEQAEEMGLPMQEGEGYTTFFELEEGQQERGQAGIDGQEIDEVDEVTAGQVGEVAEMTQQGKDRKGAEVIQEGARDTLEQSDGEIPRGQAVPNAMGVVGMFQSAARENAMQENPLQSNDEGKGNADNYIQAQEEYQAPTLDNLEDDKKGGILGFFSKIKEAVQARFTKKSEQKRLNPSSEQRTDENGWNITTYDGNGKDLAPRGTGLRNAMVRFAENTIGRVAKLTTKSQISSEPTNTPYVIPANIQQQAKAKDKSRDADKWVVDPTRLAPLKDSKGTADRNRSTIDEKNKDDGAR